MHCLVVCFFFFFQAEDGIRDYKVTGVQTCALPISSKFDTTTAASGTVVRTSVASARILSAVRNHAAARSLTSRGWNHLRRTLRAISARAHIPGLQPNGCRGYSPNNSDSGTTEGGCADRAPSSIQW